MPFVQRTMLRWRVAVALASVLAAGSAPATGLAGVPSSQPMQSDGTGSSVSNAAALKQKMEEGLRDLARRTREVHDIENTLSRMARGQLGPASNMSYIEPDGGVVEQTLSGTNSSQCMCGWGVMGVVGVVAGRGTGANRHGLPQSSPPPSRRPLRAGGRGAENR